MGETRAVEHPAADVRADPAERPRSAFRFPRVEFDLSALLLGSAAVVGSAAVWAGAAAALGLRGPYTVGMFGVRFEASPEVALRSEIGTRLLPVVSFPGRDTVLGLLGYQGPLVVQGPGGPTSSVPAPLGLPVWQIALVLLALLVFWSVAGGAISRVYAVRKARDRTVPFDEAISFAFRAVPQFVQATLFIAAAGALFYAAVALCGAATAVPWAGPVLGVVLIPLALVAGLVLLVIVVGGVLGFPMTQAAIAVERNGFLDAVSRTYSYVFTRPLTFAFGVLVVLAVGALIPQFANWGLDAVQSGMLRGASWDPDGAQAALREGFSAAARLATPAVPAGAPWTVGAWTWTSWAFLVAAHVLVRGFALSYVVGGLVDVYFILREEVDSVPVSEVYEEGVTASLGEPLPGEPK